MKNVLTPKWAILACRAMSIRTLAPLLAVIATCVGAATAHAQNNRTFVSNVGTDTGNTECSATAPCLTFAHAIAETSSGGEIDCLTVGDFGAVTIAIPVTINCGGASNGRITTNDIGILINTSGIVNLFGLDIKGENAAVSEGNGVLIQSSGTVNIRNCKIYGFGGAGVSFSGAILVVDNVFITNTGYGIQQNVSSGVANMTVRNSNINNSNIGIYVEDTGGTHAGASIEQTTLAFNNYGLLVANTGAVAVLGGSTLVNNATGASAQFGGAIYSFKNNQIGGNGSDGTPLTAYPGGPLN